MQSVIFDMDGTMIDRLGFHALVAQAALQPIRDQIGKDGDQLMPVFPLCPNKR